MNLQGLLSVCIDKSTILTLVAFVHNNTQRKQKLYDLLFSEDDRIAYNAGWVMTHFSSTDNKWLYQKQDELIDEVFVCKHVGKRRILLTLLYRQPLASPPRPDFLDFCLDGIMTNKGLVWFQAICVKLAYELCRAIPELCQELQVILEMMDPTLLSPALRAVRKNTLKAMQTGKSLQSY